MESKNSMGEELGLSAFWGFLSKKQKKELMKVQRTAVLNFVKCSNGCQELIEESVEYLAKNHTVLSEYQDGLFSFNYKGGYAELWRQPDGTFKGHPAGTSLHLEECRKENENDVPVTPNDGTFVPFVNIRQDVISLVNEDSFDPDLPESALSVAAGKFVKAHDAEDTACQVYVRDEDGEYIQYMPKNNSTSQRKKSSKKKKVRNDKKKTEKEDVVYTDEQVCKEMTISIEEFSKLSEKERQRGHKWMRRRERSRKKCCWYCQDKFVVRFVDMLTYPRPVRKFDLLVPDTSTIGQIRSLMASEVAVDDVDELTLVSKGKKLDDDSKTLCALRFRNRQMVILSKPPSLKESDEVNDEEDAPQLMEEKNKQFVGDLLFGQASRSSTDMEHDSDGSVLQHFRRSHGFQLLGIACERLLRDKLLEAHAAEVKSRINEKALLDSLLLEDDAGQTKSKKKRNKKKRAKEKKKEREKKRAEAQERAAKVEQQQRQADKKARKKARKAAERAQAAAAAKVEAEKRAIDQAKKDETRRAKAEKLRKQLIKEEEERVKREVVAMAERMQKAEEEARKKEEEARKKEEEARKKEEETRKRVQEDNRRAVEEQRKRMEQIKLEKERFRIQKQNIAGMPQSIRQTSRTAGFTHSLEPPGFNNSEAPSYPSFSVQQATAGWDAVTSSPSVSKQQQWKNQPQSLQTQQVQWKEPKISHEFPRVPPPPPPVSQFQQQQQQQQRQQWNPPRMQQQQQQQQRRVMMQPMMQSTTLSPPQQNVQQSWKLSTGSNSNQHYQQQQQQQQQQHQQVSGSSQQSRMLRCMKCGAMNAPEAKFCSNCGNNITAREYRRGLPTNARPIFLQDKSNISWKLPASGGIFGSIGKNSKVFKLTTGPGPIPVLKSKPKKAPGTIGKAPDTIGRTPPLLTPSLLHSAPPESISSLLKNQPMQISSSNPSTFVQQQKSPPVEPSLSIFERTDSLLIDFADTAVSFG
eukprot:g5854.t1